MIGSRVKSVLQALSLVTVLIFGGFALYHLSDVLKLKADRQDWYQINGAWYAAQCEGTPPAEPITRAVCQEAWGRKAYYDSAPRLAMNLVWNSLGLAAVAPLLLLAWLLVLRFMPQR